MKRRAFLGLAAGLATSLPIAARAQKRKPLLRVGTAAFAPRALPAIVAFERRMAELGYRDGETYTFDFVPSKGTALDDYRAAYREIAQRDPDIVYAPGPEIALQAAMEATSKIPVVLVAINYDPFSRGYVASLARPGGRITGLYIPQIELIEKRFQLFKEAIPDLGSVIVFFDEVSRNYEWTAAKAIGDGLALPLWGSDLQAPPFNYEDALAAAPPEFAKALFVLDSPRFTNDRNRLAAFALKNRFASMFADRNLTDAGGLMSYGSNIDWVFGRSANLVDRIARGANPADLPIEQPTKFEFVINLATARTLGIELSPSVLARADEVIE